MSPISAMAIPALGPLIILMKLPANLKKWFFSIPLWASSIAIAWSFGHMFTGVMAPYAIVVMDLVLLPGFFIIKKLYERKYGKIPSIKFPTNLLKRHVKQEATVCCS